MQEHLIHPPLSLPHLAGSMDAVKSAARRARASRQQQSSGSSAPPPAVSVETTAGELKRVFSPAFAVALDRRDPNYDSEGDDDGVALVPAVEECVRPPARPPTGLPLATLTRPRPDAACVLRTRPPGMPLASLSPTSYRYLASAKGGDALAKTRQELSQLPALSLQEFKKQAVLVVQELFISEDMDEFLLSVRELGSPTLHYELVRRLLSLATERNHRAREVASRALVELCASNTLSVEQAAMGFKRMFEIADDLSLDAPHAKEIIARFLARAVADEVLPPAFLTDPTIEKMGAEIVAQAKTLLSIRHSRARLSRCWQVPTVNTEGEEVREEITPLLKAEIKLLLNEYLNSGDINEAIDCVRRLEAPHYGHEIVKRAVVLALDGRQMQRAMMSALLTELVLSGALSSKQVELGFDRLMEELQDLELDTPGAGRVIRVFFEQALKDGIVRKVPALPPTTNNIISTHNNSNGMQQHYGSM